MTNTSRRSFLRNLGAAAAAVVAAPTIVRELVDDTPAWLIAKDVPIESSPIMVSGWDNIEDAHKAAQNGYQVFERYTINPRTGIVEEYYIGVDERG